MSFRILIILVFWTVVYQHAPSFEAVRIGEQPVFSEDNFKEIGIRSSNNSTGGLNINGPSVIKLPDWLPIEERVDSAANYYLYFAHHGGRDIRMAWSSEVMGPYHIFNMGSARDTNVQGDKTPGSGVLDISLGNPNVAFPFPQTGHIASPDIHIDHINRRIIMFFHARNFRSDFSQNTFVATSRSGLNFNMPKYGGESGHGVVDQELGEFYFRVFQINGAYLGKPVVSTFAFSNGGKLWVAPLFDSIGNNATFTNTKNPGGMFSMKWEELDYPLSKVMVTPQIQEEGIVLRSYHNYDANSPRHFAVHVDSNFIHVFYSARNDIPESIVAVGINLENLSLEDRVNPLKWHVSKMEHLILSPKLEWEMGNGIFKKSQNGTSINVCEIRDPAILVDNEDIYMFYTGSGEEAIGIAKLIKQNN